MNVYQMLLKKQFCEITPTEDAYDRLFPTIFGTSFKSSVKELSFKVSYNDWKKQTISDLTIGPTTLICSRKARDLLAGLGDFAFLPGRVEELQGISRSSYAYETKLEGFSRFSIPPELFSFIRLNPVTA